MSPVSGVMSADLLARVRAEIDARIGALRPALEEYQELLDAAGKLEADVASRPRSEVTPVRRRGPRGSAAGALELAASGSRKRAAARKPAAPSKPASPRNRAATSKPAAPRRQGTSKPESAPRGAAERAIVAALEHGSHTAGELVLVTALSGAEIRAGAKKLERAGAIGRTRREGRIAYALSVPAAQD
jgi:hypothetical protein